MESRPGRPTHAPQHRDRALEVVPGHQHVDVLHRPDAVVAVMGDGERDSLEHQRRDSRLAECTERLGGQLEEKLVVNPRSPIRPFELGEIQTRPIRPNAGCGRRAEKGGAMPSPRPPGNCGRATAPRPGARYPRRAAPREATGSDHRWASSRPAPTCGRPYRREPERCGISCRPAPRSRRSAN